MAIRREIKVGAFVFAGFLVTALVIFLLGDERRVFESKVNFHAVFKDVQGIRPGAPIRMGGVDIGHVGAVGYGPDSNDTSLHVTLEIVAAEAKRLRVDSVASIENKGLLGDKMMVVTIGDPKKPVLPPGGTIRTHEGGDITEVFNRLTVVGEKAEAVMRNLEKTTGTFADEQFRADMQQGMHSFSSILQTMDEGDGYISRLLHDKAESQRLSDTMANLEKTTAKLDDTLAGINQAVARVNQGPGFAHEIIYGDGPNKTLDHFGRAADELATSLKGIREGNGIARSVLYGDGESAQLVENLNQMSGDMRDIVAQLKAGKGTLGALLVDPSVYEDVKMLLGNVDRNKALRALVRYSIQRDEKVAPVRITDGARPEVSRER